MASTDFLADLGIRLPIIQAPMAGVSTVALAAAVSNAGGLGSLGLGNATVEQARTQIQQLKQATVHPFNINFFCHQPPVTDVVLEQAWLQMLSPYFAEFAVTPPAAIQVISQSFVGNQAMLEMLLEERPAVVSFHFGLPAQTVIEQLKTAGIRLFGCATCLAEAQAIEAAGLDAIVAQGYEAGGHRGVFDPATDLQLGLFSLLSLLRQHCSLPIIAAGGIMDGAAIATVLQMGASAAQLGSAFVVCPESAATAAYRADLSSSKASRTALTTVISGRPARGIINRMHTDIAQHMLQTPGYPVTYSAGKALHAAASAQGCHDFAAHWAGQSAALARTMPAAQLVRVLSEELS
ncbi:MAG: nitronate monooxygenase [Pseudomonas sp.]|jgi:nitronate monooxygenase|nr:nitronate monooxygenase [Pseudomonas sp.]